MNEEKKRQRILVVGSYNTDMVVKTSHLPQAGETVLGGEFMMTAGGKGANQAVAVARLGGEVFFICKTGKDLFGQEAHQSLQKEGIDISYALVDPVAPSGVALITVDRHAENCIVVASGANSRLTPSDLAKAAPLIEEAGYILMQLEIPMETVEYVAEIARLKNRKVILNPAPAHHLSAKLLSGLFLITPNETEAETITGVKITDWRTAETAARELQKRGVGHVVITLGAQGALVCTGSTCEKVESLPVNAVDTTAAGDVFNGALLVALSENKELMEAVHFATKAAAISVTRMGAQASAPYRHEVDNFN